MCNGKKKKKNYLENSFYFEYVFKDFEFYFLENLKIKKPKINNIYLINLRVPPCHVIIFQELPCRHVPCGVVLVSVSMRVRLATNWLHSFLTNKISLNNVIVLD